MTNKKLTTTMQKISLSKLRKQIRAKLIQEQNKQIEIEKKNKQLKEEYEYTSYFEDPVDIMELDHSTDIDELDIVSWHNPITKEEGTGEIMKLLGTQAKIKGDDGAIHFVTVAFLQLIKKSDFHI